MNACDKDEKGKCFVTDEVLGSLLPQNRRVLDFSEFLKLIIALGGHWDGSFNVDRSRKGGALASADGISDSTTHNLSDPLSLALGGSDFMMEDEALHLLVPASIIVALERKGLQEADLRLDFATGHILHEGQPLRLDDGALITVPMPTLTQHSSSGPDPLDAAFLKISRALDDSPGLPAALHTDRPITFAGADVLLDRRELTGSFNDRAFLVEQVLTQAEKMGVDASRAREVLASLPPNAFLDSREAAYVGAGLAELADPTMDAEYRRYVMQDYLLPLLVDSASYKTHGDTPLSPEDLAAGKSLLARAAGLGPAPQG